jgi:hypothetical protein
MVCVGGMGRCMEGVWGGGDGKEAKDGGILPG